VCVGVGVDISVGTLTLVARADTFLTSVGVGPVSSTRGATGVDGDASAAVVGRTASPDGTVVFTIVLDVSAKGVAGAVVVATSVAGIEGIVVDNNGVAVGDSTGRRVIASFVWVGRTAVTGGIDVGNSDVEGVGVRATGIVRAQPAMTTATNASITP
jgi:hypothetical protein